MATKERRRSPRAKVDEIVYMSFQSGNGGIVLNVSSAGLGFQAADPVAGAESLSFRLSPPTIEHIEIIGQLMWLDPTRKRGGLRLAHLPVEVRSQIQLWQSQYLPLTADVEQPPELKSDPVLLNAIPATNQSSSQNAPVGSDQRPSLPDREHAPKMPGQGITGTSQAPSSSLDKRPDSNAFPWPPPLAISPARMSSSEEQQGTFFDREESRGPRFAVTVSLIVVLAFLAIGSLYFGNRRWTGELLIHLGESISGEKPKTSSQLQPAEGASTEAGVPATAPAPSTDGQENGSPDSTVQGLAANGERSLPSTAARGGGSADETNSSAAASSTRLPHQAGATRSLGDNGDSELARAQSYLESSGRGYSALAAQLLWVSIGKGNRQAELELADLYLRGEGVSKNCAQARVLLTAAQDSNIPAASERLAHLRDYGCQ